MSYSSASTRESTPTDSLSASPASRSIAIALTSSSCASSRRESFNNPYSSCAHSSWQSSTTGQPSAYVSDEDLWGNDDDAYLSEPPPPPRSAEVWMARPLLPPVVSIKPRRCITDSKKKRSGSSASGKSKT